MFVDFLEEVRLISNYYYTGVSLSGRTRYWAKSEKSSKNGFFSKQARTILQVVLDSTHSGQSNNLVSVSLLILNQFSLSGLFI